MEIGKYHQLEVSRLTDFGAFLKDHQGEEVLLPKKFTSADLKAGDSLEVFVYLDNEERPTATTQKPKINLDEFALLKVADVGKHGAFLDWGLDKQLFVPFMEQAQKMEVGKSYVVRLYLDRMTDRLAASSKVKSFLEQETEALKEGEKVSLFIFRDTDLGYEAIINHQYLGLLYHNEVFQTLRAGDVVNGYIKKLREDDKIDLSLKAQGYEKVIDSDTEIILDALEQANGFLALHDKSSPADIYNALKMSKKAFKRSIGKLYKEKQIQLEAKGIRLV